MTSSLPCLCRKFPMVTWRIRTIECVSPFAPNGAISGWKLPGWIFQSDPRSDKFPQHSDSVKSLLYSFHGPASPRVAFPRSISVLGSYTRFETFTATRFQGKIHKRLRERPYRREQPFDTAETLYKIFPSRSRCARLPAIQTIVRIGEKGGAHLVVRIRQVTIGRASA